MSFIGELKRRNVIRVGVAYLAAAWLLIQVVETLFPIYGLNDAHIRIVIALLAIGFPLVLIFSWVYELTPEGIKLERDVDRTRSITGHTGKNLDRAIIVVLVLAVGFFAVDKFVLDPARDAKREVAVAQQARSQALTESYGDSSIAVLPFVDMSAESDSEFFSDGISEELLNLLSRIPNLRVISRSSAFSFKGKDFTIPEVAEKLNVALVLEGSVRRFGDDLRITAQLIEARSDTDLWSETYDRKLIDVFAIQDEISAAIVDALKDQLDLDVGAAPTATVTTNLEAHDAYLRGLYLIQQRSPDAKKGATQEFMKAVSLDPDFAPAHAELAIAIALGGLVGLMPPDERMTKLRHHAEKALELDPDLAEAHAAMSWSLNGSGRDDQVVEHLRRAVEINPNYALAYLWLAHYVEEMADRFAMTEKALHLDPLSRSANFGYVNGLIARNRLDEADRQIEKFAVIEPGGATILRGELSSLGGHWGAWALAYLEATDNQPDSLAFGGGHAVVFNWHLVSIGLRDEALARSRERPEMLAWFGYLEEGIALAEAHHAEGGPSAGTGVLGMVLAHAGYYDRARPHVEELWSQSGERFSNDDAFSALLAEALIAVRKAADDEAGVTQVLREMRANIDRHRGAGIQMTQRDNSGDYHEGLWLYMSGEREKGLDLISKAAEDGFWIVPGSAFNEERYQSPEYAEIFAMQEARQARERKRVLDVVCNDNPYAAVWDPMPETCEAHLVASND